MKYDISRFRSSFNEAVALVPGLEGIDINTLGQEVLVLIEWVVTRAELVVWWTHSLLETSELLGLLHVSGHLHPEVHL